MIPYKLNLDKYKIRADLAIWGKGGADIRPIYGPSLWISEKTLGGTLRCKLLGCAFMEHVFRVMTQFRNHREGYIYIYIERDIYTCVNYTYISILYRIIYTYVVFHR